MSVPRPFETDPFHLPSSVHVLRIKPISTYIQKCSSSFLYVVFTSCSSTVYYACALSKLFSSRFTALLKSFCLQYITLKLAILSYWCSVCLNKVTGSHLLSARSSPM